MPETGTYKFSVTSLLGCKIVIDDSNVTSKLRSDSPATEQGTVELRRGMHSLSAEFFDLETDSEATILIGAPSSIADIEFDLDDFSGMHLASLMSDF